MNTDWSYNYQTGPLPHRLWQFTKASMQSMILRPKKGPSASYMSKTDMARYFYILYHLIFVTKWPFKCIFTWAKLRKSMDHNWARLSNWIISGKHLQVREAREHGQLRPLSSNMTSYVKYEVIWRPLQPPEATKVAFRSNMHMDSRVIEVAGFKSEAIFIALVLASP